MNAQTRERGERTMVWSWFLAGGPELSSTVLSGSEESVHGLPAGIHFDERLGERVTPVSRGVLIFHRPLPLVVPAKRRLREFRPQHVNTRHRGISRPVAILGTLTRAFQLAARSAAKQKVPNTSWRSLNRENVRELESRVGRVGIRGVFIFRWIYRYRGKHRETEKLEDLERIGEGVWSLKLEDGSIRWERQWWMERQGNANVRNIEEKE